MANLIYGTTDRTQGILTYSTSETNTTYEISVKSDLQAKSYYLSGYRLNTIIGGVTEATATAYVPTLTTSFTTFLSTSQAVKTYTKGRTAQTITVGSSYAGENVSGYLPGNKSGSTTVNITIPAKPSYTVSYNANGGAGAPSNQIKWYGETLQITSTRPTRASYNFSGWATSSGSTTVAYTSGANYTANAAITLYAVWQLAYTPPKITGYGASFPTIYRADSSGNAQDEGTYAYVSFSWSTFSSAYQGQSAKVDYKLTTSSTWENAITKVISGTSGNFEETIGGSLDIDSAYDFRITVIDSRSSSNFITFLSSAFFPMDFGYGGKAIGIGTTAPDPTGHDEGLLKIKMDLQIKDDILADFVVASGTSGAWNYVKWNSGRCEAYAKSLSFDYVSAGTWSGGINISNSSIAIPNGIFNTAPQVDVTPRNVNGTWICAGVVDSSTTGFSLYALRPNATSMTLYAGVSAKGTWK